MIFCGLILPASALKILTINRLLLTFFTSNRNILPLHKSGKRFLKNLKLALNQITHLDSQFFIARNNQTAMMATF